MRSAAEAYQLIDGGANFDVILADSNVADMNAPNWPRNCADRAERHLLMMTADQQLRRSHCRGRHYPVSPGGRAITFLPVGHTRMLQQLSRREEESKAEIPLRSGSPPCPGPSRKMPRCAGCASLTAEDNHLNQLVFAKMVKDIDVDLRFVDNGREAVEMWPSSGPDLHGYFHARKMDRQSGDRTIRAERKGPKIACADLCADRLCNGEHLHPSGWRRSLPDEAAQRAAISARIC